MKNLSHAPGTASIKKEFDKEPDVCTDVVLSQTQF